jgi:hypothetical protein
MKSSILLLAFAAVIFTSCTTAYKSGQTPDDVYYSPTREGGDEYVVTDKKEDRYYAGSDEYYEDRYLRYRARSPYRWSMLDDYYFNPSYAWQYGGYTSWSNPYSSYHCWNNYYNPYYGGGIIITKPVYNYRPPSRPVAFNPRSYNSGNGNTKSVFAGSKYNGGSGISGSRYNNNNGSRYNNGNSNRNSSSFGNSVRRVFSNDNNSSRSENNSNSTPSRSYTPSTSSSSSSSSSGSSSGGSSGGSISRPGR